MALQEIKCPECAGWGEIMADCDCPDGVFLTDDPHEWETCPRCWGVGVIEVQGHRDWCHITLDCCGCNCRDAYTDYYEQVHSGTKTAREVSDLANIRSAGAVLARWEADRERKG